MRRILLVLTVAALMAAMMVTAGPAKAVSVDIDNDGGDFDSSVTFFSVDSVFDSFSFSDGVFGIDVGSGDVSLTGNGSVVVV